MKPRTIRQKEVFALSQKLKPLTLKQECWLAKKVFNGAGVVENNKVWCLACNNISKVKGNLGNTPVKLETNKNAIIAATGSTKPDIAPRKNALVLLFPA